MSFTDVIQLVATIGGLGFAVYGTGKGSKEAARWLRRRREERDRR